MEKCYLRKTSVKYAKNLNHMHLSTCRFLLKKHFILILQSRGNFLFILRTKFWWSIPPAKALQKVIKVSMHSFSINYLKYVFWWNSVFKFLVLIRLCKEASLIKRFASHHFCETNYSKISYSETDFLRNFFLGFSLLTCGIKQRRYLSMAHTDVNPYQKTANHCSS